MLSQCTPRGGEHCHRKITYKPGLSIFGWGGQEKGNGSEKVFVFN